MTPFNIQVDATVFKNLEPGGWLTSANFDAIFSYLKLIEGAGGIAKGTIVIGDNIIYPGAPDYLDYFKMIASDKYKSILYHSFLEYSSRPDAVLVS